MDSSIIVDENMTAILSSEGGINANMSVNYSSGNGLTEEQAVNVAKIPEIEETLANKADKDDVYTKTEVDVKIAEAQLEGGNVDLSAYAKTSDIPTKTSELTNDSGFLTAIPNEYVTETELTSKGYLTEHQDLSAYAKTSDIPTKTSELENDSSYATISYVDAGLENKSDTNHTHTSYVTSADVNNALANYPLTSDVNNALSNKANSSHTHTVSDITDFPTSSGNTSSSLPLEGKVWFNIGDSYSAYDGTEFEGYTTGNTWPSVASADTGATMKNCALGGAHLHHLSYLLTNTGYTNSDITSADIITIMLYANDMIDGVDAGSYLDEASESGSCCARFKYLVNTIQKLNNTAPLIFITEPVRIDTTFGVNNWSYINKLAETCRYLQIPCFDLARIVGFNSNNYSIYSGSDSLHWTPAAYARMGKYIAKAVTSFFIQTS